MKNNTIINLLAALASYGLFASADSTIKWSSQFVGVPTLQFYIALFAMAAVLIAYALKGKPVRLIPKRPFWVLLRAAISGVAGLFIFWGFANLHLAQMYTLIFTMPLFVTVLSVLFLNEQIGWRRSLAVLVGFIGVVIANRPWDGGFSIWMLSGLLGALLVSTTITLTRHNTRYEQSGTITFWAFPGMVVVPLLLGLFIDVPLVLPQMMWSWVVLAALLLVIAQMLMTYALTHTDASLVAPFQYTQIIWAFIYGALFFGELPSTSMLIGIVIIIASGIYIIHRETLKQSPNIDSMRRQ